MPLYRINKSFENDLELSPNVLTVAAMFGLDIGERHRINLFSDLAIRIGPGQIVLVTGPSGAGKSIILGELEKKIKTAVNLSGLPVNVEKPLVDCFENESLTHALAWLGAAGLCDARTLLQKATQLSEGQFYRYKLAAALWHRPGVLLIDEFCTTLDRMTAAVVSYNLRKFADRFKTTFIVATSQADLQEELAPDVIVSRHSGNNWQVAYSEERDP